MAKPKPKPEPPARSWIMSKDQKRVYCFQDPDKSCIVHNLWVTDKLTTFHDASLSHATKEINSILENVRKKNRDRKRGLSFIIIENQPFLVWTHHGSIGPRGNPAKVRRTLGLK